MTADDEMKAVLAVYEARGEVSNEELYGHVQQATGAPEESFQARAPVGKSGKVHRTAARRVRWHQQSLRRLGLVERVEGARGLWRLAKPKSDELTPAAPGVSLVGFSTRLGLALWSSNTVLANIDEPIALILTSPPYPLAKPRRYGGPTEPEMVDFVCATLEPLVKHLLPGASLALNVTNDIFIAGSPARSTYVEELILALRKRLSLQLMDRLVWNAPSKPPGPIQWASKKRVHLATGWEPVYWFTNDPARCFADNRRVLEPHTERHLKLMAGGGERRTVSNNDGAYKITAGKSFAGITPGRIPRNVQTHTHHSNGLAAVRQTARELGLPVHGAVMPLSLAKFLVTFLTLKDQLVVDPWAGWGTSSVAAEDTGRRWLTTERIAEYVAGHALRLTGREGFRTSFDIAAHE